MDKIIEVIRLDDLRRKLAAYDYDILGLACLEPLRAEVRQRLDKLCGKGEKIKAVT